MGLSHFHPVIARWWAERFGAGEPTEAQRRGWASIRSGRHTLIAAPTGSGKTLAAFLHGIDSLLREGIANGGLADEVRIVYVSPLKALSADIHHNLSEPLSEIERIARDMGLPEVRITAAVRTGDTSSAERARTLREPPNILVTTPESLFLLLTAERSRGMLRTVRTVIVDEIHAVIESRRGAHLALTLERLCHVATGHVQRIGLSATQRPIEYVAGFLAGAPANDEGGEVATGSSPAETKGREGAGSSPHARGDVSIVDTGHLRDLDLALELPDSPLEAVMSAEVWEEVYDRLTELILEHRTTLVFVNTRRLAERVARHLAERLGSDVVATHHGSLSLEARHAAESALKEGRLGALVATSSLELGIDIGHVDLVCQLGTPRRIATLLQRVGRSGHTVGGTPRGRLFPLNRDELIECTALLREVRRGNLDRIVPVEAPLDVLAQQIVAETAAEDWPEDALYELVRRAWPYRELSRQAFDDVVDMLARGFTARRARRGALIHRDAVNRRLRGRPGARLTALTAGGAIPEVADYRVILEPEGTFVGTVNEDFAVESMIGDVFQLGNTSWRVLRVQPGVMRVADAGGELPNIPFWLGEAPARSDEVSAAVSELRAGLDERMAAGDAVPWLQAEYGIPLAAAEQVVDYLGETRRLLGVLPSQRTLVLERFFDEAGGMQLVLHAPFGARVNRAWGLALRKKFCRTFNFELQGAATDEAILLSLGPQHSFPLEDVFRFLRVETLMDTLVQAVLDAPVFQTRWRWVTNLSLAVPRARGGSKVPPQIQRMQADDLLAAVFPDAAACFENIEGDREVPDHPLVNQTLNDCLTEAMDLPALERIVADVLAGRLRLVARDLPEPSPLAAQVLSARLYEFLDDTPLEERRTQAVQARRAMEPGGAADLGALDEGAIRRVRDEAWPDATSPDELHDALLCAGFITAAEGERWGWTGLFAELAAERRAVLVGAEPDSAGSGIWVATERLHEAMAVLPEAAIHPAESEAAAHSLGLAAPEPHHALRELIRGRLEVLGPVTAEDLAATLGLDVADVTIALTALEAEGVVLRGRFTPGLGRLEWCDRRLLARIHRYTLDRLRAEIQPVSLTDFQRFLLAWQHVHPEHRLRGTEGVMAVIEQLDGFQAPARAWERYILPARVADYTPAMLDELCAAGRVGWGRRPAVKRVAPRRRARRAARPAFAAVMMNGAPGSRSDSGAAQASNGGASRSTIGVGAKPGSPARRSGPRPVRSSPIALFVRSHASTWMAPPVPDPMDAGLGDSISSNGERGDVATRPSGTPRVSTYARLLAEALARRGALFYDELVAEAGILDTQAEAGLAELVAGGYVTADRFAGLRALLVPSDERPRRWNGSGRQRRRRVTVPGVDAAGRWALLPAGRALVNGGWPGDDGRGGVANLAGGGTNGTGAGGLPAPWAERDVERWARTLLRRYGVVFRRLLAREAGAPPWRELARTYRRMEARGEIRGGHFVAGVSGEQFALLEAVGALRAARRRGATGNVVEVSAADPLNLEGILSPGPRVPAITRVRVRIEA